MTDNELLSLDDISGKVLAISVIYDELYNYISSSSDAGGFINRLMVDNLREISEQIDEFNTKQCRKH